jgi:Phosphoglycerate dehydrogenase and related dehydrogenases
MNLLLTGAYEYTDLQIKQLEALGYRITFVQDEREPLFKHNPPINLAEIEVVVCNGLFLYNKIEELKSLKFIQLTSAGLDRIPVEYVRKHAICLSNARGVYSLPMAEWVVLKILEIYKKTRYFYAVQSEHKWLKNRELLELAGKKAAIIGFGDVGAEIAKRLKAFDVDVIGVDNRSLEPAKDGLIKEFYPPDEIDQVLNQCNIVILALPLTEQSRHLMNRQRFAAMQEGSVLINVSRGGVIDETALIEALQVNKLLGAALDVFEEEPLPEDNPLWDFDRVIITPHNSFVSDKVNERLFELIIKNLTEYSMTYPPQEKHQTRINIIAKM